jgi:hypothetical protein
MENQLLCANLSKIQATWQRGASIAVIKISAEILEPFDKLGLKMMRSYKDKKRIFENPLYNEIILEFVKQWLPYIPSLANFKAYGLNIAPGGMPSITNYLSLAHDGRRQFIGLHIDENDVVPVNTKMDVRNRFSVNLGRNDRYLMFINLTIVDLYRACKGYDPTPNLFYSVSQLTEEFFALYPTYPVIRLRIRPGEAYIAPSQNIIHDAYNPESSHPDITLNFIGHFNYKPDYNSNINV